MPLRFTRRVSLIPGLRANFSKSGVSLSIGHRGPHGRRGSAGPLLDGTLSAGEASARGHRAAFVLALVLVLVPLAAIVGHPPGGEKPAGVPSRARAARPRRPRARVRAHGGPKTPQRPSSASTMA